MKIASVHIENFRSFADTTIPLNDYSCLVGPNGSGKSTVLTALNVFFRESENIPTDLSQLDAEDFHCKNTTDPIRITVTFTDLSTEAQEDFSAYCRQGELIVSAVATFDENTGRADVKQYGQRSGISAFAPFFEALDDGKKVSELKDTYISFQSSFPDLPPPGTKDAMIEALRNYEAERPDQNEMFFTRRLILVEGLEDRAYLLTYLKLLERYEDYRRMGCHVVPANRKSELIQPLIIAKHMGIPTYVIFDADADKPDKNGSRMKHEQDNKALLTLLGVPNQNPMPDATVWDMGFTMWQSDIGSVVEADIGKEGWQVSRNQAEALYGHAGGLKKNVLHIGASLAFAWDQGKRSCNLERLCHEILNTDNQVALPG